MKVYKMIVDKKPSWCLMCPLKSSGVKMETPDCGSMKTVNIEGGWQQSGKVPDERCLLEELED